MTETRGDIAVGPQQVGGSRFGVVTRARKTFAIGKAAIAADPDRSNLAGRFESGALPNAISANRFFCSKKASLRNIRSPSRLAIGASSIEAPGGGPPRQVSASAVDNGDW